MSDSVMVWFAIAVLLFWSMGAYNRLVRLRSQGNMSFVALEGLFNQYVLIVRTNYPDVGTGHSPPDASHGHNQASVMWGGLVAAAEQFNASLRVAHAQPLNGSAMRALGTALTTLCLCWSQLRDLPSDLAGPALPGALQLQWEQVTAQVEVARAEFNQRVLNYNEAIDQFPALLLARVFGFKPAQPI